METAQYRLRGDIWLRHDVAVDGHIVGILRGHDYGPSKKLCTPLYTAKTIDDTESTTSF